MTVKELYDSFGGDYSKAVQTMMNDAFITRMLTKFVEKNSYQDIIANYENKNYHGVFEGSHSLKGVCGNLALTPLFEKASVLCEATRNVSEGQSVEIAAEINELKESYKIVVGAIKAFLGL